MVGTKICCPSHFEWVKSLGIGPKMACIKIHDDGSNYEKALRKCNHPKALNYEPRDFKRFEAFKQYVRDQWLTGYDLWVGAKRIEGVWKWVSDGKEVPSFLIPRNQSDMQCYFKGVPDDCCVTLTYSEMEVNACRLNSPRSTCWIKNAENCTTVKTTTLSLDFILEQSNRRVNRALILAGISLLLLFLVVIALIVFICRQKTERKTKRAGEGNLKKKKKKKKNKDDIIIPVNDV